MSFYEDSEIIALANSEVLERRKAATGDSLHCQTR